ncbi:unnamed protein product [Linum tenue]|uniref:TIR domain-containing protein n=2 Tax=Linum tenue TaxID=586396 RepID=A0AAV0NL95_9ROSI|nr:unnamed protein product [Linum tenue]
MSSSSSSSSHRVMDNVKWEYDVFVCFRGTDTRNGFTSHLMEALSREQIKVFLDDMLEKTECIDVLITLLRRSALSIVIFSENFADSSWCLDEVATISQSMEEFGHRVLPVFYKVDPSEVTEDFGSYANAIERKYGARPPKFWDRKRRLDALKAVANCAGHTSQAIKIDSELIKAIVNDVLNRLVDMSPRVKSNILIGMDARVSGVERLLAMNEDAFRIIGLWGMGGVGKTTLARVCYQRYTSLTKEIKHYFVRNINQTCEKENGMEGIVTKLYSTLLSESNINFDDLDVSYRRSRLSRLKVFLVFDDLGTLSQLEQLLLGDLLSSTHLFAAGSRIIFTTRNRMVLGNVGARIYHVDFLDPDESLQLFGIHAFGRCLPPDDWMELSHRALSYCKGSPLAIKVFGGALSDKDKNYWLSFLGDMRQIPTPGIHDVLKRSYNALGVEEKRFFLDIACFFYGTVKSILIQYYHAHYVLENLIDKSLCICVRDDLGERIQVHDLLREMAWSIVNEETKLENRTRLKNIDDIHKLLTTSLSTNGGRATEGIYLDLSQANEMRLEANAFEGMTSLRFLRFFYPRNEYGTIKIHVSYGGLHILPNSLRWLIWHKFTAKSLPSTFSPDNLVTLSLRGSPVMERCWKVEAKLVNLVWLDLSNCINLVAIPDLSWSSNLEYLYLQGCKSLTELPCNVGDLDKLTRLDLSDCTNLRSLPANLNSKCLKDVRLSNCPKITSCPEISSGELEVLDLTETPIIALPAAIYNIKQGGWLRLCGKHISNFLPISASLKVFRLCHTAMREMDYYNDDDRQQGSLPRFVRLELVDNPQLKSLSRNIWKMVSQILILQDCQAIETLPRISQPLTGLTELRIRGCRNLKSFPTGINHLKSLQVLHFTGTDIKSLPFTIHELDQLSTLVLCSNKSLEFIPSNIHKLVKLSHLILMGCSSIKFLPELPSNLLNLDVSGCTLLQALPSNIGRLRWKELYFEDCPQEGTHLPQEVVLNFHNHAVCNLHPQGVVQHSGSEIPKWFAYKSANYKNDSCMMVQLPPNSTIKRLIKGIAFGVVCSSDIGHVAISMTCDCNIGTATAVASWSSPGFGFGMTQSDNVYMWYDKNLLGETKQGMLAEAEPWYERYDGRSVSFRFTPKLEDGEDSEKLKSIKIKGVGVSLMY